MTNQTPEIIFNPPPPIQLYSVNGDQLQRIEESCSSVGEDLTFAIASFSTGLAFLIALLTGTFSETVFAIFVALVILCSIISLYTGLKWRRGKNAVRAAITAIRGPTQPELPPSRSPAKYGSAKYS